ncbi:glycosyltransferase [Synechococcus sp. HK05]|nr:glycosyltransferase [Synechococcus sp. HK05]
MDLAHALRDHGYAVFVHCVNTDPQAPPFETRSWIEDGIHVQELNHAYQDLKALAGFQCVDQAEVILREWVRYYQLQLVDVHHTLYVGVRALPALSAQVPVVATLHDYWLLDPRGQLFGFASQPGATLTAEAWEAGVRQTWPHLFRQSLSQLHYYNPTTHLDRVDSPRLMQTWQSYSRRCLSACRRLVAPSEAAAATFLNYGFSQPIRVIENGIDPSGLLNGLLEESVDSIQNGPIRMGLLGNVAPSKGQLAFCEALLSTPWRADVKLHLYGQIPDTYHGDSSPQQRLKGLMVRYPELILWHGAYQRDQLKAIFAGLDLLVMPSLWPEVYGLIAREALCYGLPLIVSNAGALAELDGRSHVFLLDAADPAGWSEALNAAFERGPLLRWVYERRRRILPPDSTVRTSAECAVEVAELYQEVLATADEAAALIPAHSLR